MAKPRTDAPCTQAYALACYSFDGPYVRNLVDIGPRSLSGMVSGYVASKGYQQISINGRRILAHRLVWFAHTGIWPILEIDHIDGDKQNNRICNLREVDQSTNCQNLGGARKDSATGIRNVRWPESHRARGARPRAVAWVNGKQLHLGTFDTVDECQRVADEFMVKNYSGYTGR